MRSLRVFCLAALIALLAGSALAQVRGQVRIQGRDSEIEEAPTAGLGGLLLDYREEMRKFVQSISGFTRRYRPNFLVIPQNGLDLLVKIDDVEETRVAPARTYMRSIDGVLQESLQFGYPEFGMPTPDENRQKLLALTEMAKANGLKVLVVDYVKETKGIDESYRLNSAKDFIPFAAPAMGLELNRLPDYPSRPFNENPFSVISLGQVKNFAQIRESAAFGVQQEFVLKMHDTNYDMIIVDVFHKRQPLSKRAVETLKYKKTGGRRLVLAHVDIGSAASYFYYWKPRWREGSPLWISAAFPGDPDKYYVEYWRPEWQKIITGNTESYIYGIIAQGFDGVVLDGMEAYRFFEGGGELEEANQ
ncbi:MAG: endo alpha-1,4 polygalactosaminidase [Proteobacteria bacterium]|nr:endo alpha-1,4 polygalactosaminidase [Pseudomonadota bacterium]